MIVLSTCATCSALPLGASESTSVCRKDTQEPKLPFPPNTGALEIRNLMFTIRLYPASVLQIFLIPL